MGWAGDRAGGAGGRSGGGCRLRRTPGGLARTAGDTGAKAWLLPASVDGLVVASTMCIYRASKLGESAGFIPWGSLGLGLAASVVGNVVSVNPELVDVDQLTIAVGAWPPLALALAFDMALRQVRAQ